MKFSIALLLIFSSSSIPLAFALDPVYDQYQYHDVHEDYHPKLDLLVTLREHDNRPNHHYLVELLVEDHHLKSLLGTGLDVYCNESRISYVGTIPDALLNAKCSVKGDMSFLGVLHMDYNFEPPIPINHNFTMAPHTTQIISIYDPGQTHTHDITTQNHIDAHKIQDNLIRQVASAAEEMRDHSAHTQSNLNYDIQMLNDTLYQTTDLYDRQRDHLTTIVISQDDKISELEEEIEAWKLVVTTLTSILQEEFPERFE